MIGIARNHLADRRASAARRVGWRGDSALRHLPDESDLSVIWDAERNTAIFNEALVELRASTRFSEQSIRAFELVGLQSQSPDEVARTLGMTRHDVYVAKHRVTERLREIVGHLETLYDAEE